MEVREKAIADAAITAEEISADQEWQWCLVGNIVGEHEHGENHELRSGTKQFRPGAKVFINLVYGGMGHENILVIGTPRHLHKYIEIVIARKYVENFRLQKVFKPAVLKRMDQSAWDWWGNTDSARDQIIKVLEWLNPAEAERAKNKLRWETQMQVIDYFDCDRPEYWLCQIKKSDWGAGQFLYKLLRENNFKNTVGENSKVLMLTDGDELISFCTYAEKDDIQPTDLTPWIGFVYTFPEYRGHRHVGKLFQEIEKLAKSENVHDIYISTNHTGLYEKYGCEFYQIMNDMYGEPSRVYRKHVP